MVLINVVPIKFPSTKIHTTDRTLLNLTPRGCTVLPSGVFSRFTGTSVSALAREVWNNWDDTPADLLGCAGSTGSLSCLGGCSLVTCSSTSDCMILLNSKILTITTFILEYYTCCINISEAHHNKLIPLVM